MFSKENNIWQLLIFDKGDIFTYLIVGIVLIYIWKTSNIKSMYLLPFIIFIGFMYFRQDYHHKINLNLDHKIEEIKKKLLKGKYPHIASNNNMMFFLNSIEVFNKYNPQTYIDLLNICEKCLKKKDIFNCIDCVETYEAIIHSLPVNLLKTHYLKKKELASILKDIIVNPTRKTVEMQSYIPFNLIDQKYDHLTF